MTRGVRTDLQTAATAKAMRDVGYDIGEVARKMGMAYGTVQDIVEGVSPWDEITKDEPVFQEYRESIKKVLLVKGTFYANQLLDEVYNARKRGTLSQKAIAYGILRTHARLDAGEPTAINETIHAHQIEDMDKLAQALLDELKLRKQPKIVSQDAEFTEVNEAGNKVGGTDTV